MFGVAGVEEEAADGIGGGGGGNTVGGNTPPPRSPLTLGSGRSELNRLAVAVWKEN